jgi:ribonuclease P protein component
MGKLVTLNKNKEFKRVYSKGKYAASPSLVTYVLKSKSRKNRIGITTTKKIGNAVQRNRCRRIIRAAYAQIKNNLLIGNDIVFVAREKTVELKTQNILRDMQYQFRRLNMIRISDKNN